MKIEYKGFHYNVGNNLKSLIIEKKKYNIRYSVFYYREFDKVVEKKKKYQYNWYFLVNYKKLINDGENACEINF